MNYDPKKHSRQSIRLKGYDYSKAGSYFITVCCENRENRFGKIENNEMILNEYGKIAFREWKKLGDRFIHFELDVFQIMPNHIHGIIGIKQYIDTELTSDNFDIDHLVIGQPEKFPLEVDFKIIKKTVGDIVGAYKSLVSNKCLEIAKQNNEVMGKLWQRNLFEHIIRDEKSYQNISDYIINNPSNWKDDKFFNE